MALQEQKWTINFKNGVSTDVSTPLGLNPLQGVAYAGYGAWEVASIVPKGVALVNDIAAWRAGA